MRRADLVSDCGNCAAVCCVATSFEASDDFAFDKPAGVACRHLMRDHRCAVHAELSALGCSGCVVYECYGAGPRVTRAFAAAHGRPLDRNQAFLTLRVIHELLWLSTEAAKLCPPSHAELATELEREIALLDALATQVGATLPAVDLCAHRDTTQALLRRVGHALGGRRGLKTLVVIE